MTFSHVEAQIILEDYTRKNREENNRFEASQNLISKHYILTQVLVYQILQVCKLSDDGLL